MGALSSSLLGQPQFGVIVIGLDAAGKTTMLHTLKNRQGGQIETTIPTIGFHMETLEFQGSAKFVNLKAWDVGGRTNIRPLIRHWFAKTDGIIFVLDSRDPERFEDASLELHRVLAEDNLYGKPLLVLANKQDLPRAAKTSQVVEVLSLHTLRNRMWYVEESVATTGRGLWEGLDWLTNSMKKEAARARASLPPPLPTLPTMPKQNVEKDVEDDVSTADTEDAMVRAEITQG